MTAETLSVAAGVILSLLFSYMPGLSEAFAQLGATEKRFVMLALLAVVTVGVFMLSCANIIPAVECTQVGAVGLFEAFIMALVANQATFAISPKWGEA
jgi:hypothetical protein